MGNSENNFDCACSVAYWEEQNPGLWVIKSRVGVRKVKRVHRTKARSERDALFVLKVLAQHLTIFSRFPNPSTSAHHRRRPRRCLPRIHHVTRSYLILAPSIRRPPSSAQVWRRVLTRSKSTRCAKLSFRPSMVTPKYAPCFLSLTKWNVDREISQH